MSADPKLDVDALVRDLEVSGPRLGPPAWPPMSPWERLWAALRRPSLRYVGGGVLVVAALLLALRGAQPPVDEIPGTRGVETTSAVRPHLDLVLEQGGQARRLARGEPVAVGERVFFRVSASAATQLYLAVEGPGVGGAARGRQLLASAPAGPTPTDLGGSGGLHAWRFDAPGPHTFTLSTDAERCVEPGCARVVVEAR